MGESMNNKKLAKTIAVIVWEVFAVSMIIIYSSSVINSPLSLPWILLGILPSIPLWVMIAFILIEIWLGWVEE